MKKQNILRTIWAISIIISIIALIVLLFVALDILKLICFGIAIICSCVSYIIKSLDGRYIDLNPKADAQHYKIKYNNYDEIIKLYQQNSKYNIYENRSIKIDYKYDDCIIESTKYLSNYEYKGDSIVDGLKQIGVDSSYNYRSQLALLNNIESYRGMAEENIYLLTLLKLGMLKC